MAKRTKCLSDIIFCVVLLGLLGVILFSSFGLPVAAKRLPIIVCAVTLIFTVVQLILNLRTYFRLKACPDLTSEKNAEGEDGTADFIDRVVLKKIIFSVGFMALTLILWVLAGYLIAALISSALFCFYLGERRKLVILASCVITTMGLWLLFDVLLKVPVPQGIIFGGYWG